MSPMAALLAPGEHYTFFAKAFKLPIVFFHMQKNRIPKINSWITTRSASALVCNLNSFSRNQVASDYGIAHKNSIN